MHLTLLAKKHRSVHTDQSLAFATNNIPPSMHSQTSTFLFDMRHLPKF